MDNCPIQPIQWKQNERYTDDDNQNQLKDRQFLDIVGNEIVFLALKINGDKTEKQDGNGRQ